MYFGVHGVEEADRDVVHLGGEDTGGVENLCAEIGELGGFVKREFAYGLGVVDEAGVVIVHTVDVGPDLDLVGKEGSANERGGVVGASALEVVDLAERVAANVAPVI